MLVFTGLLTKILIKGPPCLLSENVPTESAGSTRFLYRVYPYRMIRMCILSKIMS